MSTEQNTVKVMVTLQKVIQAWNEKADEYNQWDALSDDEKFDLVGKEYDARIKELEDGIRKTIDDNMHLSDGDDCTLAALKKIIDWS
jgi:hypothetical protein